MGDRLATPSCVAPFVVDILDPHFPVSVCVTPYLRSLTCRGAAPRKLPGMGMLSGRKWPFVIARINDVSSGHPSGRTIVNI